VKEIVIESDGRRLIGRCFEPREPGSGAAILFVHGLGSDQSGYRERAEAATRRIGARCLTFDLAGHGDSDGDCTKLTLRDHLDDCVAAFDALAASGNAIGHDRIGICAASYGGYLASVVTSRRRVRSVLLRAPGLYGDEDLDRVGLPDGSSPQTLSTSVALRALSTFGGSVLVLESERDATISHDVIAAYLAACKQARHMLMRGVGHQLTDPTSRAAFIDAIVEWFGATLVGASEQASTERR
jgi:pimeloyl-ACP methyl ester carboxylesterase